MTLAFARDSECIVSAFPTNLGSSSAPKLVPESIDLNGHKKLTARPAIKPDQA